MEAPGSCHVLFGVAIVLLFFTASALARPCHDQKPAFFFFPSFDNPAVMSDLTLHGDAQVSDGRDGVVISGSEANVAGQLFFTHPIGLKGGGPLSFSTSFTFSMAGGGGDGLAFVIAPSKDFPRNSSSSSSSRSGGAGPWLGLPSERDMAHTLAVEFDTKMDEAASDPNGNHVGLDVGSFVSLVTANVSDVLLTLNGGQEMRAWINYHAASQTLQVRLSESSGRNHPPPPSPLLSYRVDLSSLWNNEMYVGFTSSTGSPRQKHVLHSWDFSVLRFPPGTHSFPANPFQNWHGPEHEQHGHEYQWHSDHPGYWHGHWGPENQHPSFGLRSHLQDVGRVAIGILLGAICGAIVAITICLLIGLVAKLVLKSVPDTKKSSSFTIFGYQKLPTTETRTIETSTK